MNTTKFLKIVIFILLLINVATITFLWINKPRQNDTVGDFFAKELKFTDQQKEQFEVLRDEHRAQRESLKESNKEKHDAYFDLLKNPNIDSVTVRKAAQEITKIKEQEELSIFYHFQKVRAICDDEQQHKFDKIINEAAKMMNPQRPPRRVEDGPPHPRM